MQMFCLQTNERSFQERERGEKPMTLCSESIIDGKNKGALVAIQMEGTVVQRLLC